MCFKIKFTNFKWFFFIIINVKTLFNFEKEWYTFDKEKECLKKKPSCDHYLEYAKGLSKHYQFASIFDQWNFINNGILKGKENENLIFYAPLVIFQKYKITILSRCDIVLGSF